MSGTILQLHDSTLVSVSLNADDEARVRFDPGMVVKSQGIPRVDASTLWRQSGELVIPEAEIEGEPPELPVTVRDGSMETGGLKYMDMVPVPLDDVGYAELRLSFADGAPELVIRGAGARLEMEDIPKYIKHIEETQPEG
jgi:hypothetical protein